MHLKISSGKWRRGGWVGVGGVGVGDGLSGQDSNPFHFHKMQGLHFHQNFTEVWFEGFDIKPYTDISQIAKFMGPTWGPHGSCRPQMGSMWAPWTLLWGILYATNAMHMRQTWACKRVDRGTAIYTLPTYFADINKQWFVIISNCKCNFRQPTEWFLAISVVIAIFVITTFIANT